MNVESIVGIVNVRGSLEWWEVLFNVSWNMVAEMHNSRGTKSSFVYAGIGGIVTFTKVVAGSMSKEPSHDHKLYCQHLFLSSDVRFGVWEFFGAMTSTIIGKSISISEYLHAR